LHQGRVSNEEGTLSCNQVGRLQQAFWRGGQQPLLLKQQNRAHRRLSELAATYYILTLTAKVIEIDDIEKQVSELERAAELSKETG
jgi:hypothetical protein